MNESTYDRGESVCVIGAGASGLAAIKNLTERGFAVDCYERETGVGGAWNWRHDRSPVHASTHLLTSRPGTQYPDFPMPDHWPDYPHHSLMLEYLERYADHFGLREHLWLGSEVTKVEPVGGGSSHWNVTIRGRNGQADRTTRYSAVVVANGHHWAPRPPEYQGLDGYRGTVLHASAYSDPAQLRGKKVLVVGAGNSGCEIAVEAARTADKCWHSSRRGSWRIPKYLLGRPYDQVDARLRALRLPQRVRARLFRWLLAVAVGDPARFGLPRPDHRLFDRPPIINSELGDQLGHGDLTSVPDLARFGRDEVVLVDGRVIDPEIVIFATGYLPRFEFLSAEYFGVDQTGRPRLRWHCLVPDRPTLAMVGLVDPDGDALACAHWQSALFARWLRVFATTPEQAARFWERHRADDDGRYRAGSSAGSGRYWFEVDHVSYLRALQRPLNDLEAMS